MVDDSMEALPRIVAIRKLTNTLLADRAAHIAPYVGTAAVARDMLTILEALGQGSFVLGYEYYEVDSNTTIEKLQYWGISYGSVLGMTYVHYLLFINLDLQ
jgi:hypothetical protein